MFALMVCRISTLVIFSGFNSNSCREGKPHPNGKGGKASSVKAKKVVVKDRGQEPDEQSTSKMAQDIRGWIHTERQMKSLERLHNQSDVQGRLKMQKGYRLKLDSPHAGQKRKTRPTFEIQFTEVEAPADASDTIVEDVPEDNLPSIEQLFAGDGRISANLSANADLARDNPVCKVPIHMSPSREPCKRPRTSLTEKVVSTKLYPPPCW